MALALDTLRTATVEAHTPCEVFKLRRDDYATVVDEMPPERRQSPLDKVVRKFWELISNENRGRQKVDYAKYLQLHLRVARTLTEEEGDFDESDEREGAQADWAEDCQRAGLKSNAELDRGLFTNALVSSLVLN